jgi:capsular polysaccharide biosynthesis protein
MNVSSPEILKRLVRRFGLLVLLTVLGGAAGAAYSSLKTPTYTAQAYVVVTAEPGEAVAALNFAQAYGRIATKGAVTDRAAATLGSAKSDLKQVTASTSPDTPVIEITSTGTKAQRTADVANAVAKALVDYGTARKDQTRVGMAVLAAASVPRAPSSPKPPLELAVGAAGGLLIGGLAVLAGVGRSTARRPEAEPEQARYDVEDYEDPATARNRITSYRGTAAPVYTPKAITSYSADAAPAYPHEPVYDAELNQPTAVIRRPQAEQPAQQPVQWQAEQPVQWQAEQPVQQPVPWPVEARADWQAPQPVEWQSEEPPVADSVPAVDGAGADPGAAQAGEEPTEPAVAPAADTAVARVAVPQQFAPQQFAPEQFAPQQVEPQQANPAAVEPAAVEPNAQPEQVAIERVIGRASVNREQP